MARLLRIIFPVFALLALVIGLFLLIAPGRFLGAVGWAPVEPILDRILGSALIALGWASFRAWRSANRQVVMLVTEINLIFCALAALGVLRHLAGTAHYPAMVWTVFAILGVFAIVWLVALLRRR